MNTRDKNKQFIYFLSALTFGMLGLSFASVPLYRLICQKTGFGGTPQMGLFNVEPPKKDHYIRVKFSASIHRNLPWHFIPKEHEVMVKIGEPKLVYYHAENKSSRPIIGMATYNVSPDKAGIFFGKIQCFCFEEQKLEPNEALDLPVLLTISPDILKDPLTKDLKTLTLSYTFFELKK